MPRLDKVLLCGLGFAVAGYLGAAVYANLNRGIAMLGDQLPKAARQINQTPIIGRPVDRPTRWSNF